MEEGEAVTDEDAKNDSISICPSCNCMTKTMESGACGKCKAKKMETIKVKKGGSVTHEH